MLKTKAPMLRWSLMGATVLLVAVVFSWLAMFATAKWYEHRVNKLAERIRGLSVGKSTFGDVQKLESDYQGSVEIENDGCTQDDCGFQIVIKNTSFPAFYDHSVMWRLGIRPTFAAANLRVRKGSLRYASFLISTRTQYGYWLEASFHAAPALTMYDRCSQQCLGRNSTYAVEGSHLTNGAGGGWKIRTAFSSNASAAERAKATALRLSCITAVPSCRRTTDLMPRAHEGMTFDPDRDASFTTECEAYVKELEVGNGPWRVESAFSADPITLNIWTLSR